MNENKSYFNPVGTLHRYFWGGPNLELNFYGYGNIATIKQQGSFYTWTLKDVYGWKKREEGNRGLHAMTCCNLYDMNLDPGRIVNITH